MKTIPYEDLERHFTAPKQLNKTPFYNHKRLPRKLKKRIKKEVYIYCGGNINKILWYSMEENYKRFIIKQVTKIYN